MNISFSGIRISMREIKDSSNFSSEKTFLCNRTFHLLISIGKFKVHLEYGILFHLKSIVWRSFFIYTYRWIRNKFQCGYSNVFILIIQGDNVISNYHHRICFTIVSIIKAHFLGTNMNIYYAYSEFTSSIF